MEYNTISYKRIPNSTLGQGTTVEYRTVNTNEVIAFVDYTEDGKQAAVKLFAPGTTMRGTSRYDTRPADKAEGIVNRHLHKQGYTQPLDEHTDRPVDNEIADRALKATRQLRKQFAPQTGIKSIRATVNFDGRIRFAVLTDYEAFDVDVDGKTFTRNHELARQAYWLISDEWGDVLKRKTEADDAAYVAKWGHDATTTHMLEDETPDYDIVPELCPRCGLHPLNRVAPVMNSLSRVAPVYICNQCGNHEAMLDYYGPRDPDADPLDSWVDSRRARAAQAAKERRLSAKPQGQIAEAPGKTYAREQWPVDLTSGQPL